MKYHISDKQLIQLLEASQSYLQNPRDGENWRAFEEILDAIEEIETSDTIMEAIRLVEDIYKKYFVEYANKDVFFKIFNKVTFQASSLQTEDSKRETVESAFSEAVFIEPILKWAIIIKNALEKYLATTNWRVGSSEDEFRKMVIMVAWVSADYHAAELRHSTDRAKYRRLLNFTIYYALLAGVVEAALAKASLEIELKQALVKAALHNTDSIRAARINFDTIKVD
jgi:hypothetical protein